MRRGRRRQAGSRRSHVVLVELDFVRLGDLGLGVLVVSQLLEMSMGVTAFGMRMLHRDANPGNQGSQQQQHHEPPGQRVRPELNVAVQMGERHW